MTSTKIDIRYSTKLVQYLDIGAVTNAVIYWNTLYMEAALTKLKEDGYPIISEDIYHLSPLIHEHINFIGKYNFISSEKIKNGQLRELNHSQIPEKD